ncbi:hypothetical protein BDF19DRAFT_88960 [Syncephalis fuscata]|nr:hypothetical protein BDF19DRAFT_88960 [Syncephalis fuscata]
MVHNDTTGDINISEYIWQMHDDKTNLQRRYVNFNYLLVLIVTMAVIFIRNTIGVGIIAIKYPYKLAPWCCFFANISGAIIAVGISTPAFFAHGPSCNTLVWAVVAVLPFSSTLINIMLFERAYLAFRRSLWFLLLGILFIVIPGPTYFIAARWSSTPRLNERYGCYLDYPQYLAYIRLVVDLPCNIVCSVVFSIVIYRQYKRYRDDCWKHLARNGIITMV